MTHVLHLGHQPTDISGISGLISSVAAGFEDTLDINGLRFNGARTQAVPFAVGFAPSAISARCQKPSGAGRTSRPLKSPAAARVS